MLFIRTALSRLASEKSLVWMGIAALLLGLLIIIWPIPRTISLRLLLETLLLGIVIARLYFYPPSTSLSAVIPTYVWFPLIGITLWIFFHNIFLSIVPEKSWNETFDQWILPLIMFWIGAQLSRLEGRGRIFSYAIFFGLITIVFMHSLSTIEFIIKYRAIPWAHSSLTGGKDKMAQILNVLIVILMTLMLTSLIYRKQDSVRPTWLIQNSYLWCIFVGVLILLIVLSLQIQSRNGLIGLSLTLFSFSLIYAYERFRYWKRTHLWLYTITAFMLLSLFVGMAIKTDARWQRFIDTIPIALKHQGHQAWTDYTSWKPLKKQLPKAKNGETVDGSAYFRIASINEGLQLIIDRPLGYGFNRGAWGTALREKYQLEEAGYLVAHSHSGLLDWAIALGLPGLVLWLGFIGVLLFIAIQQWLHKKNQYALMLLFVESGFFIRSLVDSHIRDYMLETFLLLSGFILGRLSFEFEQKTPKVP